MTDEELVAYVDVWIECAAGFLHPGSLEALQQIRARLSGGASEQQNPSHSHSREARREMPQGGEEPATGAPAVESTTRAGISPEPSAEPVAYALQWNDTGKVNADTTFPTLRKAEQYRAMCSDPKNIEIVPLYRRAPEPGDQHVSGWVIEGAWSPTNQPDYWVGSSAWSTDPYKALRFATQQSALQAAELMCSGVNVRICAHEWAEQPPTKGENL